MAIFTLDPHAIFASTDENGALRQPAEAEVETLITEIIAVVELIGQTAPLIFSSRASLYADLVHDANTAALVIGDSTVAYNGLYRKNGASGAGSWTRVADLPGYPFILATNTGAVNPNDIIATTTIPVPSADGGALIAVPILAANNSSPVTLTFNGDGHTRPIKTASGANVAIGGLTVGMVMLGYIADSGASFRIISDQASAAIQAASEAAQAAAEAARDQAIAAAAAISDVLVLASGGQSNILGNGDSASPVAVPTGYGLQYYSGSLTAVTGDPVGNASTGSPMPALMRELIEATGKIVCVVPCAVGGTPMIASLDTGNGNWSATGALRGTLVSNVNAAMTALRSAGHNPRFIGVAWSQGETDANGIATAAITKADYKTAMQGFLTYLRGTTIDGAVRPGLDVFISTTGGPQSGDTEYYLQVRAAQWEIADADPYTHIVFDGAQEFIGRTPQLMQSGSLHYTIAGYDEMGTCMARGILRRGLAYYDRWWAYTEAGTLISSLGNGTKTAYYQRVGRRIRAMVTLTLGSTTTINATQGTIGLPTFIQGSYALGIAHAQDVSASVNYGGVPGAANGLATVVVFGQAGTTSWRSTVPMTWATSDNLRVDVDFPCSPQS